MISYYCIINLPGVPVREIAAVRATYDKAAREELVRLAERWPGYETITLYEGERPVFVLANPSLGFSAEPLELEDRAA